MRKFAEKLFDQVDKVQGQGAEMRKLPENTWYVDEKTIACFPRKNGDSRYPYGTDGYTLWAYQSGYLCANESTFTVLPYADEGKQPYFTFFAGIRNGEKYQPLSLTGAAPFPQEKLWRCTVFTPSAAYYLTRAEGVDFTVRVTVDADKRILASICAVNRSGQNKEISLSFYLNCLLRYMPVEDVESKWYKKCSVKKNGFLFESVVDLSRSEHKNFYGVVNRCFSGEVKNISSTTSRADFAGGKTKPVQCSDALFTGKFERENKVCGFTDTAIAGEIVSFYLPKDGCCEEDIIFTVCTDKNKAEQLCERGVAQGEADKIVDEMRLADDKKQADPRMLKFSFGKFEDDRLNGKVFEKFAGSVVRQVESCALAKTSSISMLGIRDVFQQIESALIWNPSDCRKKILEAMSFIGTDGRAPRQYSLPASKESVPLLDLREFIDQGVWIIDTVYTYLSYTGDTSLLSEECGYYVYRGRQVSLTNERDSVFCHLKRIMSYLIGNIDKNTGCLRILYGDWNDALDGLGTGGEGEEFGNGVSVMATLQLYKNLEEMEEICRVYGISDSLAENYEKLRKSLSDALFKFGLEKKEKQCRVLHGWGNHRSYFVGSFCDVDGKARDGLAANAFWVLSGLYAKDKSIHDDILAAYERLDSKYGLKTFEPPFERGTSGVGRIPNLPAGTAENGATYVHATLFGIWSLFYMNEPQKAWEQLFKVLPPVHKFLSTSPFVMSNSYLFNEELGADGESMNDWYTGSATVLLKVLCRCVFGIEVSLKGLKISPASYLPCKDAAIHLSIRGKVYDIKVENIDESVIFSVNGKKFRAGEVYSETFSD